MDRVHRVVDGKWFPVVASVRQVEDQCFDECDEVLRARCSTAKAWAVIA